MLEKIAESEDEDELSRLKVVGSSFHDMLSVFKEKCPARIDDDFFCLVSKVAAEKVELTDMEPLKEFDFGRYNNEV